ncbi:hypothetical protein [Paracoccus binzhouensis]|uniref:hypothetical protein n=1 Tax=Paracoccus binzhouensis TaxID=2796149 RepID=UPI0018EF3381|nr:hypothetical protein [Paracoccus binzhouensis]
MSFRALSHALGGLTLAATLTGAAMAQETVTYATDGGNILDVMTRTLIRPAEAKYGLRVVPDPNADRYPVIKAQVMSGKPT